MSYSVIERSLSRLMLSVVGVLLFFLLPVAAHAFRVDEAAQEWLYAVQRGDNLYALAERFLQSSGDWAKLQRLNRVANPYQLPVGSTLRIPLPWLRKELTSAQVSHVRGSVQVVRGSTPGVPLVAGEKVYMGDALSTGPESSVTVQMLDGSQLLVLPDSQLSFQTLLLVGKGKTPHTQVMLLKGGVETQVQPRNEPLRRYEIKTPTATLGARGTAYRVRLLEGSAEESSAVEVTEGQVAATATKETLVQAGYGLVLNPGASETAPTRLLDAPVMQNDALRLDRLPLRVEWPGVAGAVGYRAQVFSEAAPSRAALLLDTLFANNTARWSELPDGTYQLRVRAVDAQGLEGRDATQVLVIKARPEPPVLRSPRPQSKAYGDPTTLQWAQVSGVVGYRLQVFNEAAGGLTDAAPLVDQVLADTPLHTLPLPPGHYQWRVASIRAGRDQGPYGDATSFEQRPVPASPSAEPPKLDGKSLTLSWRALLPGQQVELQLAPDASFDTLVVNEKTSATELTLPTPPPGRYHLRMRTLDADGFAGPFGAPQQIEVPRSWRWLLVPATLLLLAL
jgi:hypothetical protein